MRGKPTTEREKKSDENHREGHNRETDVRDEQRKVDVTEHPQPVKAHVTMEGMIGDVGDEEKRRKDKRCEHGSPVLAHAPSADEEEADDQGRGGKGVQEGVQGGKEEQVGARNVGRRMIIDEPAEKGACPRANGNDGGDDAERCAVLVGGKCRHGGKGKEHTFSFFANGLLTLEECRGIIFLVARSGSFMEIHRPAGASSCLVEEMRNAE